MSWLRDLSVSKKVPSGIALACLALVLLSLAAVWVYENATVAERTRRTLDGLADLVEVGVYTAVRFNDDETVQETLSSLRTNRAVVAAEVRALEGRLVARHQGPGVVPGARLVELERQLSHEGRAFAIIRMTGDPTVLFGARLQGSLRIVAFLIPILAVVAWLFSLALKRAISDPLIRLAGTAARVTKERSYDVRSGQTGRDEVGQLAAAFDEMLVAIAQRDAAQRRMIAILDATPDLVGVADPQRRTLSLNRAGRAMMEIPADESVVGLSVESYHPAEVMPVVGGGVAIALRDGNWTGETEILSRGGRRIPVSQVILAHRSTSGELEYLSTVCRDLTETKRAEARRESLEGQLRQAQKMEAIGQLAGGIAHDFNNLLTSILGFTELSALNAPPGSELADNLGNVSEAARRAQQLTRQLLAFARRQTLELRVVDMNEIVSASTAVLRRLIRTDVRLVVRLGPSPLPVEVDRTQLEQVLMNLALNGQDAMPDGGSLLLETSRLELPADFVGSGGDRVSAGPCVVLSVTDTGVGMDAATRERIFEPFFTTKEIGKGTGLGLAISHGIVKQHHGAIGVESEPGKGARFAVYLPLATEAGIAAPAQQPRVAARAAAGETLLVVEDDPQVLHLVSSVLRERGYRIISAADAAAAQRLAREHAGTIDLLVTDVLMPETDGRRLAEILRTVRPNLRVLFMSGYEAGVLTERGALLADVSFIAKPFTMDALARAVRSVLDHGDSRGEST